MKKETQSPAQVAAKIEFSGSERYLINDMIPTQCVELIEAAIETGLKVNADTKRYPFDRRYPNVKWDGEEFYQTSDNECDGYKIVSFDVVIKSIKELKAKTIKLNDEYTAYVHEDNIIVGCQEFDINIIKKIVKLHSTLYGKSR